MINYIVCLKKPNLERDLYKHIGSIEDWSGMGHFILCQNMVKFLFSYISKSRFYIIFCLCNIYIHKIFPIEYKKKNYSWHWYGTSRNKSSVIPISLYISISKFGFFKQVMSLIIYHNNQVTLPCLSCFENCYGTKIQ